MKLASLLLLVVFTFGCGYGSSYNKMNSSPGTVPNISQLIPSSAPAGHAGFVLTINGTGFGSDTVVFWNSQSRSTSYAAANQLTTMVSASDVAAPGTASVYVQSHGQKSATMTFTIN
jgi:hypothetical protein